MSKQFQFYVERLDVFQVAVEFVAWVRTLECFAGDGDRKKQLWRAADSIALNIAEGVGRGPGRSRLGFFRIAMGSASECAAVLAILAAHGVDVDAGRDSLRRVGAMLSRMRK